MRFSSGDPIVDRRYLYAQGAAADGDWRVAAEMLEQALEIAPRWAPAWLALGQAREELALVEGAVEAYRAALALDPEDALGAEPRLARLGAALPAGLRQSYVRALFDDYAPRYGEHLRLGLAYRGPELILEALDSVAPGRRYGLAADLGCGDGLIGAALRSCVEALIGVDLSAEMLDLARKLDVYDALERQEICAFLERGRARTADLVVAADCLPYFGDLTALFAAIGRALRKRGLFAFTAEFVDGVGYAIGRSLRFAHSGAYLRECAAEAGLTPRLLKPAAARREKGLPAPGWVGVFERT
ncbi:MAG TPA: methyltransferase domain-containing protein [Roseiarcus sp.]|nr:methyltransferase domain-containing protein [Roseiarcus sp.]